MEFLTNIFQKRMQIGTYRLAMTAISDFEPLVTVQRVNIVETLQLRVIEYSLSILGP